MGIRIHAAQERRIPISDGVRLITRPSGSPRVPLDTRVGGPRSLITARFIRRCSDRRSGRPPSEARCVFSLKKTDAVGFEPTNDFRRCRFSRSAKGLGAPPGEQPWKEGRNVTEALGNEAPGERGQDAESSQSETRRAKSRPLIRQVSDKSRLAGLDVADERERAVSLHARNL